MLSARCAEDNESLNTDGRTCAASRPSFNAGRRLLQSLRLRGNVLRIAAVLFCSQLAACTAYRLPEFHSEHASIPVRPLFGVVRVAFEQPEYPIPVPQVDSLLNRLRADLSGTGLFEAVVPASDTHAELTVYPEYTPRNCFSEPLFTVLTLGLLPNPGCYYSGYRLTFRGFGPPNDSQVVDNLSQPVLLWGWLAGPISALPGWSSSEPREQEVAALRATILGAIGGDQ